MPTTLPAPVTRPAPVRRLSWRETARLLALVLRLRCLSASLFAEHYRMRRIGPDAPGDRLLRLAHRWLDAHEAIAALLGIPEPPEAAQVRAVLRASTSPKDRSR